MRSTYDRFIKVFKLKEQICIYGINWKTHGYISNIEPDGVTLTQPHNQKGIKYPWNCFEVICHAGYRIIPSTLVEVENIFEFKLVSHLPKTGKLPEKVKSTEIKKIVRNEKLLFYLTYLKFKVSEIKVDVDKEGNGYLYIDFSVGKGRAYSYYSSSHDDNAQLYPLKDNSIIIPSIKIENISFTFELCSNIVSTQAYRRPTGNGDKFYFGCGVDENKRLQNLREGKEKWEEKEAVKNYP